MKSFLLSLLLAATTLANPVNLQVVSPPTTYSYGYAVGYMTAFIDGQLTQIICDDLFHNVYIPSPVMTYLKLTPGDSATRFYAGSSMNYGIAALLLHGLYTNPTKVSDYQFAIWNLFSPAAPLYGDAATVLSKAITDYNLGIRAPGDLTVYTPVGNFASSQEFLTYAVVVSNSNVPEPFSLGLCGVGLVALGIYRKRHDISKIN